MLTLTWKSCWTTGVLVCAFYSNDILCDLTLPCAIGHCRDHCKSLATFGQETLKIHSRSKTRFEASRVAGITGYQAGESEAMPRERSVAENNWRNYEFYANWIAGLLWTTYLNMVSRVYCIPSTIQVPYIFSRLASLDVFCRNYIDS